MLPGNGGIPFRTTDLGFCSDSSEVIFTFSLIAEYQEKLKALEAQKTEAENLEIVQMVRALRMTPTQLSAMLSGGTVPGSLADDNNEQEENSYEE